MQLKGKTAEVLYNVLVKLKRAPMRCDNGSVQPLKGTGKPFGGAVIGEGESGVLAAVKNKREGKL